MSHDPSLSFSDIMRQTENQMRSDEGVFANDQTNPHKVVVVNKQGLFGRPLLPFEERMLYNVQQVDEYAWSRGAKGGLDTGYPQMNEALEGGVQSGLILFAAAPNVGKSSFMLQVSKNISENNDNVYVSYHSLDDSNNMLLPRYVACDQQITIAQAQMPERFVEEPEILDKRNEGMKNIYRRVDRFGMNDSNFTTSVEGIEQHIKDLIMYLPEGTRIVIAIDSFNDLTVETQKFNNSDARNEYVAKAIKDWTVTYNAVVMCTAHLRKTNGKRPTVDDLKDTIVLQYEANLIFMMYNEVGVKEENASVYWLNEEDEKKMSVLEVKYAKNKFSSFKGTKFYEFIPDKAFAVEASPEAGRRYASLIYQG
jgi:replicative DNA helicase